ncbi:SFT2 [Babesia ovata]|uniref:Vesicle transport protein n=1 Tax=Babesia ovata TaxID=189622 RepID=A0A2H6K981_9APIC|nr:SFT2 [Babesia ovata]GBE59540.1 SFT2 [Babesia ovata]
MSGRPFSSPAGANDFLNFEAPSYGQFSADSNGSGKMSGTGFGSSAGVKGGDQSPSGVPPSDSASSTFGRPKEDNYLLKGIEFVKSSASNIQKGFGDSTRSNSLFGGDSGLLGTDTASTARSSLSALMNVGRSVIGLSGGNEEPQTWLNYTNYKIFVLLFITSLLFFALSFMTLPFIVFAPHKFGLLFTCATISFMSSLAFLKGTGALMEHMLNSKRIVFTGALGTSLVATFVFTTIYPIYLLAFISSLVQTLTLASVILSYIPGGAGALKLMYSSVWEFVKSRTRGSGSTTLPL